MTKEDYVQFLEQENKHLKKRIDKATEFLIKYITEWYQCDEVIDDMNQLSNILKGESNE